jgi:hypothetical protein
VDRYSFIVMDLHHLLRAGLPATVRFALVSDRIADIGERQKCAKATLAASSLSPPLSAETRE